MNILIQTVVCFNMPSKYNILVFIFFVVFETYRGERPHRADTTKTVNTFLSYFNLEQAQISNKIHKFGVFLTWDVFEKLEPLKRSQLLTSYK